MGIKAKLSLPFAHFIRSKTNRWASQPFETQKKVFQHLIKQGQKTKFGKDHHFQDIHSYEDFKKRVPIRVYEGFDPYISLVLEGERNVLWPGKPLYLSKTSGTTAGAKYIPLTKESLPTHIEAARNAILNYIAETGKTEFVDGKMIFLQGSPALDKSKKIPVGRLSGIVAHYVPNYLQKNRLPSFQTNCIEDWEEKVDQICKETSLEDLRLISGIPPWVQMYFERLIKLNGLSCIQELFPKFSLFIYGGVNYEPYRASMEKLIGKSVDSIELYPASEGFIAYQDSQKEEGMLLLLNAGIFYEFIPADQFHSEQAPRLTLEEIEMGVNYVLILSNTAGLWAYNIGDTVKFVCKSPFRIVVTGRIKHFTSAFGEHVIAEEVEKAMHRTMNETGIEVSEFHLAPQVNPEDGELPYHEWFVELNEGIQPPENFAKILNREMAQLNPYYNDLIEGKILQQLKVKVLPRGSFQQYMKSQGKLGGQNKLPRLANDRKIADSLILNN